MTAGIVFIIGDASTREVSVSCPHGAISVTDTMPSSWSDDEQFGYACALHQLRAPCGCVDVPEPVPETVPDTLVIEVAPGPFEIAGFENDDDPSIERERPKMFPPLAVQLAAQRLLAAARANRLDVNDRGLRIDVRLWQWFRQERDRSDEVR